MQSIKDTLKINGKQQGISSQNNIRIIKNILFRDKIRIEILDGSIRISTNGNGTWMKTGKPFELKSSEIRRDQVTHMYVGVAEGEKGNIKVKAYKYV